MKGNRPKAQADLDPFSQQRAREICERWVAAKRQSDEMARRLWLGVMVTSFDDQELAILNDLGYLCPLDHDYLRSAGRAARYTDGAFHVAPWPSEATP